MNLGIGEAYAPPQLDATASFLGLGNEAPEGGAAAFRKHGLNVFGTVQFHRSTVLPSNVFFQRDPRPPGNDCFFLTPACAFICLSAFAMTGLSCSCVFDL